jgi:hypothetical protein
MPAETLGLVEGYVLTRSLGPRPVRGRETPPGVYEITGASPIRSRLHAAAARGLTPFVGRDPEIQQLGRVLERARSGSGQLAAVVGDAGVGKSRLYWEFIHSSRTEGCLVLESTSVSYGKATAYLPVIDLLRMYFKIDDGDVTRTARERITGKLFALDENLRGALLPLLSCWGSRSRSQWNRSAPATPAADLDAVKRLLLREPGPAGRASVRGSPLDRQRDAGSSRRPRRESADGAGPALVNHRPEYQHA